MRYKFVLLVPLQCDSYLLNEENCRNNPKPKPTNLLIMPHEEEIIRNERTYTRKDNNVI